MIGQDTSLAWLVAYYYDRRTWKCEKREEGMSRLWHFNVAFLPFTQMSSLGLLFLS
jgi:hypothetical protein